MVNPIIITIHGNSTSPVIWNEFIKLIGEKAVVIAVTIPGHGGDVLNKQISFADAVDRIIVDINEKVTMNEKFHLIGASLGGHLAVKIASLIPKRILSIAITGTPLTSPLVKIPQFIPKNELIMSVLSRGLLVKEEPFTLQEAEDFTKSQDPSEDALQEMIDAAMVTSRYARCISLDYFSKSGDLDEVEDIIKTGIPIHYIHGKRDAAVNVQHIKEEIGLYPNGQATFTELDDGHSLVLSKAFYEVYFDVVKL